MGESVRVDLVWEGVGPSETWILDLIWDKVWEYETLVDRVVSSNDEYGIQT